MPFDLVPRLITPDEWRQIERGLEQRVRALNLFLHDVYHEQRILEQRRGAAGAGARRARLPARVPRAWTCRSASTPTSSAATWCATPAGAFFVLEDNLRTPSGVSYLVENRRVLKRTWPQIFHDVRRPPGRGVPAGPAGGAARDRAADRRRADRRGAHAGRLQLGLLRARLPGQGDGRRAGAGLGPVRRRRDGLHAHDAGPPPRGRDLPPRRRRLPGPADVPSRTRCWACPGWWRPTGWAGSAWRTPSAPASPTTRRSTPTSRGSSATTWARTRSSRTSRRTCRPSRTTWRTCWSTWTSWW